MDDFSLRSYVRILERHWRRVAVAALLGVLVAWAATTWIMPVRYTAESTVVVRARSYKASLESGIEAVEEEAPAPAALAALAKAPSLLRAVVDEMGDRLPPELQSGSRLAAHLSVASAANGSVLRLRVTAGDPILAAEIADAWAGAFVRHIDRVYISAEAEVAALRAYESALAAELAQANSALAAFRSTDASDVLRTTIVSRRAAYAQDLGVLDRLDRAALDLLALRPGAAAELTELGQISQAMAALLIEANALASSSDSPGLVTLQLDPTTLSEGAGDLDGLLSELRSRRDSVEERLAGQPAEIMRLQGQLQEAEAKRRQLEQSVGVLETSLEAVRLRIAEIQVDTALGSGIVSVASSALLPSAPSSPKLVPNLVVGVIVGLALGILAALWREAGRLVATERPMEPR